MWLWIGIAVGVVFVGVILFVIFKNKEEHTGDDYVKECLCPKDEHGNQIHDH